MIVVDEISKIDWYWKSDPTLTTPYINHFNNTIKENKSINQKRERLEYMYNQSKSTAIAALMPNALHIVNIAVNAGNPLKAAIAVSGAALSSTFYNAMLELSVLEICTTSLIRVAAA